MSRYAFTATDATGKEVAGVLSAADVTSAEAVLIDRGLYAKEVRPDFGRATKAWFRHSLSKEVTRITRQFQLLVESRLTIPEVLDLVSSQTNHTALKQILTSIQADVEAGRSLAESFGRYPYLFDDMYVSLLEAGEVTGQLSMTLNQVAIYREAREEAIRKIQAALSYPVLVLGVAVAVISVLILYVVPIFAGMYANFNAELPALTRFVVDLSGVVRDYVWWLFGILVVTAIGGVIATSLDNVRRTVDRAILTVPLISRLSRKILAARFCQTLGILLTSGVKLVDSLSIAARTTGNRHVRQSMTAVHDKVVVGRGLTEALEESRIYPYAMLRLVAAGERTGELGQMTLRAATYFEQESQSHIKTITSLIEPLTILVLGAVVAFILVAMYLPLFDLVNVL